MSKKVRKAVIPAAGLGTRMLPISRCVPKEMLPIVDRPAISYLVNEAFDSGITDVLIITGREKEAMEDYFDFSGFGEHIAEEHDGQFVDGGFIYYDSYESLDELLDGLDPEDEGMNMGGI